MRIFSGVDATQAIIDFYADHSSILPKENRDLIRDSLANRDFLRSVIVTMENLYAARGFESFEASGIELLRDLSNFVQANNFYGLADRALSLLSVSQRMISGGPAQEEGDPEVSAEYTPNSTAPVELEIE